MVPGVVRFEARPPVRARPIAAGLLALACPGGRPTRSTICADRSACGSSGIEAIGESSSQSRRACQGRRSATNALPGRRGRSLAARLGASLASSPAAKRNRSSSTSRTSRALREGSSIVKAGRLGPFRIVEDAEGREQRFQLRLDLLGAAFDPDQLEPESIEAAFERASARSRTSAVSRAWPLSAMAW